MAIAPPTITATIGTSRPPKLVMESINLTSCSFTILNLRSTQGRRFFRHGIWVDSLSDQFLALAIIPDHLDNSDDGTHDDQRKRNQQEPKTATPMAQNDACHRFDTCHRLDSRHLDSLVELTGIEPVASWLQTRRSPS
jgi:hypothetical protein